MSTLQTFVLDYLQHVGGIIEPVAHGVHEVVLPDEVAQQWHVPAYQQIAFDDVADAPVTRLAYNHPLVEELIASARSHAASTCGYINDLRLDKPGLADLARSNWILPNSRVVELREGTVARVRSTYVLFNFKAALVSDEKHEQLVSIVMDVNAGHAAEASSRIVQAVNGYAPDATLKTLPHAPMRWGGHDGDLSTQPLALATLHALLQRAQTAVQRELAEPVHNLQQRSQRFRELDEARLQEYYDEIARDLQQRLGTAQPERRASLEDKLTAVAAERATKLADVAERYQVRLDLTLLNLLVIVQPKLVLPVSVETRTTKVRTYAVWDPLLHRLEPLVCTVCGEPSERTFLCHHGHFAHPACLAPACVECKRAFCLQCADAMGSCAVCQQPLCRYSRLACRQCGRGTCQEHTGLCHAHAGQPAALQTPQPAPETPDAAPLVPPPAPKPIPKLAPKTPPRPAPRRQATRPRSSPPVPLGIPKPQRLEVIIERDLAAVAAYVLASRERQVAVRAWELRDEGIAVFCQCEKGRTCPANHLVLRPANAAGIEKQLLVAIDELRQEYGVPSKKMSFNQRAAGHVVPQRRFTLQGDWKDDAVLNRAREGFRRLL
jgi:hypothetical protein